MCPFSELESKMESGKVTLSFTEANYRQAMSLLIANKIPFSGTVEAGQTASNSDYAAAQRVICEYSEAGNLGETIRDLWNITCERLNSSTNCA